MNDPSPAPERKPMPEYDRPAYDQPTYDRPAQPAAGPSWPAAEQHRPVGVVDPDPRTEEHGWPPVAPPAPAGPAKRTFSAKVTAAIAGGAFLVGAAAAILIGGLTGPGGAPGGGPGGGMPPGVSSSQDGGTGTGTAPGAGTGSTTGPGTGTGTGT
jgi:hypothetical protein